MYRILISWFRLGPALRVRRWQRGFAFLLPPGFPEGNPESVYMRPVAHTSDPALAAHGEARRGGTPLFALLFVGP